MLKKNLTMIIGNIQSLFNLFSTKVGLKNESR